MTLPCKHLARFTLDAVDIVWFGIKLLVIYQCLADVGCILKVPLEALLWVVHARDWVIAPLFIKVHCSVGVSHTAWDDVFAMASAENKHVFLGVW